MSYNNRNKNCSVDSIFNVPHYKLDFFQAVRKLEGCYPEKPSVGNSLRPDDDVVRFAQKVSVSFATSTISDADMASDFVPHLIVNFMGLLGPNGPMPLHITEKIMNMVRNNNDDSLKSFLDIFNNRMIALFYKAWSVSRPAILYGSKDDRFGLYISSIAGIAGSSFRCRDTVSDDYKRYYAARLSNPVKNPQGLTAFIEDYLGFAVGVKEFVGQWLEIQKGDICLTGLLSDSSCLGRASVLGKRVWSCQSGIEVKIGPVDSESYEMFFPGQKYYLNAVDLIKNYCGNEYSVSLRIVLRGRDISGVKLGRTARLGYSSWLNKRSGFTEDAGDLLLRRIV